MNFMEKRSIHQIAIALFILPLYLPPCLSKQLSPVNSGILGVIIHQDTKQSIAGVEVRLAEYDEHTTSADASGKFPFNNLPAGKYKILVSVAGYYVSETPVVTVVPGRITQVEMYLEKIEFLFDEVIVTTDRFPTTVSRQSIQALEIKRIPRHSRRCASRVASTTVNYCR